ncbi:MAG: alpha/beta fold hydrolase [Pseudobdellovibrio sp.]
MSILIKVLVFFFAIIFIGLVALFFNQAKLVFYPVHVDSKYVFNFKLSFEEKYISYGSGKIIHGLLFKPENPIGRILYFHGNAGALDSWGYAAEEIAIRLNCQILIIDYPGFGKSTGGLASSEVALFDSAEAAFKVFEESTNSKLPLIVYGRSLGSGIASHLAAKNKIQALILETPYISIKAMAKVIFPLLPSFFVRYNLNNQENINKLSIPILILHGTADALIPFLQSAILSKENANIRLVAIAEGTHNNLSNFQIYWDSIQNFIQQLR